MTWTLLPLAVFALTLVGLLFLTFRYHWSARGTKVANDPPYR
jgi:hypothetical protein